MRGTRVLVVALVVLALATVLLARGRGDDDESGDRPTHLVDLPVGSITRIDVRETATGRTGTAVPGPALRTLEEDLAPLLAIRTFDHQAPDYGLDPPRLAVTITTARRTVRLLVGADNVDRTGVYVRVGGRTALVLPRVGTAFAAIAGQAEP